MNSGVIVFLIGPSGVGKSEVAPLLAARRGVVAVDTDHLVELRVGRSIGALFAAEGEAAFRRYERDALLATVGGAPAIVAVGAGALATADVGSALRAAGWVILLNASPQALLSRLGAARDRPLLANTSDLIAALDAQRAARLTAYRAIAHHEIDTTALAAPAVVTELERWLDACATAGHPAASR